MAETLGIFNNAPASRAPAASSWKLLYTSTQNGFVCSVHVNNASGVDSGFRIAVIPASVGYVDGAAPPLYSIVSGSLGASHTLENLGEYDSPSYTMGLNDVVVVYCENVGVTFLVGGILFS